MTVFKNKQSKMFNSVHGTTALDHKLRIRMKMSCDEYVMADAIHKMMIKGKEATNGRIHRWTGFSFNEVNGEKEAIKLLVILVKKGWIVQDKKKDILVTKKYQAYMDMELDDDYEFFWLKREDRMWTGSKPEGKKLFEKLSVNVGSKYLIQQKEDYFKFLLFQVNRDRPIMNVTTFLNQEKERFKEPWDEYLKNSMKKAGVETDEEKLAKQQQKPMTYDEKEKRFE